MDDPAALSDIIFRPELSFQEKTRRVLNFQLSENPVYRSFYETLRGHNRQAEDVLEIPLLPIRAFSTKKIVAGTRHPKSTPLIFKSSGTSGSRQSTHVVTDPVLYERSAEEEFCRHFSSDRYAIIAALPGYRDNPDSSLVYMLRHLIQKDPLSMMINQFDPEVLQRIEKIAASGKKWVLFGAAFGLLDLIEQRIPQFSTQPEIIETGGMKTYRREISKKELRNKLSEAFQIPSEHIHSEYGMCELLSQMYAIGSEWFGSPPWVQVTIRNPDNPMELCEPGTEGKIGIIDLANIYSCPFILTGDRGVMREDGKFRVLGRWNQEDLRGCNFLIDRD